MCQKCVDAMEQWFPDLPREYYHDFLMATTAFPFTSGEDTKRQVAEMARRSGGDHNKAMSLACQDMEDDMREHSLTAAYDGNPFPEPR